MQVALIHNPKAGDRKHSRKQLTAILKRQGHQALYQSMKKRGWKKALKKPVDLVIAAGGDGTVRKTACQIMGSGLPLAIFPLGTANNLARNLGFTAPVKEIVQSLDSGKHTPFDIGAAWSSSRPRYFFEGAGGALFADYFHMAESKEKKGGLPEKKLRAHLLLLRELALSYPARQWEMRIDGEDISGRYILWGAMNIRSAGPALRLAPRAATDDGRLDFVAVREHEREIFIKHIDAHLDGRKDGVPLRSRKFRKLKIMSPPRAMHIDGKQWPRKKKKNAKRIGGVAISLMPAALTIWHCRTINRRRGKAR